MWGGVEVLAQTSTQNNSDSNRRSRSNTSRDSRRESRNTERESRSRSSRSSRSESGNQQSNSAAKPADAKTVSGKDAAKSGSSSSKSAGPRKPIDVKFEGQVDPETNVLYIEGIDGRPSLNINATENKKFTTRLVLSNPRSSAFSQLDASIRYNPEYVRPIGIDDSMISSQLEKPARVVVDRNRGLLSIAADFKEETSDSAVTFARIQWQALRPVANSPIAFVNTEAHPTGVFSSSGRNVLHIRSDGTEQVSSNAGLLDASVSIEPTEGTIELAEASGNTFSTLALATNINAGTAVGGVQLYLRPRKSTITIGEPVLVDIMYDNPKRADMDTVRLKLRFDPTVLQVEDYDEGNWITRGINIFDGEYHEDLPFDHHRKNAAHNNLGIIEYDMGFGERVPVSSKGIIATIRFQAIAPAASTPIAFSTDEDTDNTISFLGFNLIGTPTNKLQAMTNASIAVRPE